MPISILIVVNDPAFFLSHRLPIALGAKKSGYDVHIATAPGGAVAEIKRQGFTHHSIPLSRSGQNLVAEMQAIIALIKLFRELHPSLVHLVTIKPVIYGGIAARIVRVPSVVAAVSGLGSVFVSRGLKADVMRSIIGRLYKLAFNHKNLMTIFQNPDDQKALCQTAGLALEKTTLIRGSGVFLDAFPKAPEPDTTPVVCFAARLLREKGIFEFVEAARLLRKQGSKAQFWVVGDRDPGNPSTVTESEISQWQREQVVNLMGYSNEIPKLFACSNIVALPSYREGLPKTLVEAAAAGRAVVTTDVPGCRDAITPDETGLLVPVRDAEALANAIQYLIENPERRREMGRAGRKLAEEVFDVNKVVEQHLRSYEELLANVSE